MDLRGLRRRVQRSMKREGFAGLFKAVVHRMRPENATDDTTATVDDVPQPGFDKVFDVDTQGEANLADLDVNGSGWYLGEDYVATNPSFFYDVVGHLPITHEDFAFLDCGSGKGRVLMMAADYPYKRIIGVEYSRVLHDIAERNLLRYESDRKKCLHVGSSCADMRKYDLPTDPLVLYMFNPFDAPMMRAVLTRVQRSLDWHPRPFFLVYVNPHHRDVVAEADFLELFARGRGWRIFADASGRDYAKERKKA